MIDIPQFAASIAVLTGVWFYGQKNAYGPFVSFCACLAWAVIGCHNGMIELVGLNLLLGAIHIRNLFKWSFWYRGRCPCIICRAPRR